MRAKINITIVVSIMTIVLSPFADAQNNVHLEGKVMDTALSPIENAIVNIGDSLVAVTSKDGLFSMDVIPCDTVFITVSHLSYESQSLTVNIVKDTTIYIQMTEQSTSISGASVSADKPRIYMRHGNMVVNIADNPSFMTQNMQYVLKRLPGVSSAKKEGITLNGIPASIEIDGRKISLGDTGTEAYLQALSASTVEEVELTTVGDGTDSAADAGAVINIITKKQTIDGYYFSANGSGNMYLYDEINADGRGTAMFVMKKKNIIFNTYLQYRNDFNDIHNYDSTLYAAGIPSLVQDRYSMGRLNTYIGEANVSWEIKKGHKLNINVFGYEDFDKSYDTEYRKSGSGTDKILSRNRGNDDLWTATIDYSSPDSLKNRFSVYYDFSYGGIRLESSFRNAEAPAPYLSSDACMTGTRHTAMFDYTHSFPKGWSLSAGVKTEIGKLNDDVLFSPGSSSDSHFTGKENIYQGYLQVEWKPSEQWSFLAAARAEHTDYDINLKSDGSQNGKHFTDIFPYAKIVFMTRDRNYKGTLGFTSMITRPNYRYMLPGLRYINDYSHVYGNPELDPTYTYSGRLNNYILDFITLTLRYDFSRDLIGNVLTDDNGIRISSYQNYADQQQFYAFLSIPFLFAKDKVSGQLTAAAYRTMLKNPKNGYEIPAGKGNYWSSSFQLFADYKIHRQFSVNIYGYFEPYKRTPLYAMKDRWSIDAGVSFMTKDEKTIISLDIEDVFNRYNNRYIYYYGGNVSHNDRYMNTRFIKLSIYCKLAAGENVYDRARSNETDISRFQE